MLLFRHSIRVKLEKRINIPELIVTHSPAASYDNECVLFLFVVVFSDKRFSALGFGARIPPNYEVSCKSVHFSVRGNRPRSLSNISYPSLLCTCCVSPAPAVCFRISNLCVQRVRHQFSCLSRFIDVKWFIVMMDSVYRLISVITHHLTLVVCCRSPPPPTKPL